MSLKVLATCFLTMWLLILGVEFSEDLGFFHYDDPNLGSSMDTTLAGFGEAIKVPDNGAESSPLLVKESVLPVVLDLLAIKGASFARPKALTRRPQKESATYKLHTVLLL